MVRGECGHPCIEIRGAILPEPDSIPFDPDDQDGGSYANGIPPRDMPLPLPSTNGPLEPPPLPPMPPLGSPTQLIAPVRAASAPEPAPHNAIAPASAPVAVRDRVVILGRTQAGKTVFVSRLYEQLWNSKEAMIHMRALSGVPHVKLMSMMEMMRGGRWPEATLGQQFIDVECTFARRKFRLTLLDYPGEVFSKAFVRGELDAADAVDLVEHVDRAAGAILLVDPQSAVDSHNVKVVADIDYAMNRVIHRIRDFPGGDRVPIAIVLTKCDLRHDLIRSLGGLKSFARTYLLNLLRPAGPRIKLFQSVAVWTRESRRTGERVPDLERSPVNLVEPLTWVLQQMIKLTEEQKIVDGQNVVSDRINAALVILNDTRRSVRQRIREGEAALSAAISAGGEASPDIARARSLLEDLEEELKRITERNVLICVFGALIGLVAVGFGLWRLGLVGSTYAS